MNSKMLGLLAAGLLAGPLQAFAAPTTYIITFKTNSPGVAPASGSFTYDSAAALPFSDFFVSWNGLVFDLTSGANEPWLRGNNCGFQGTGAALSFALLSNPSASTCPRTGWAGQTVSGNAVAEIGFFSGGFQPDVLSQTDFLIIRGTTTSNGTALFSEGSWSISPIGGVIVGGKEWRQLTETTNLSWNQVATVCNPTTGACSGSIGAVSFDGWTWAANTDIQALFEQLIDPLNPSNFPTATSVYAPGGNVPDIETAIGPAAFAPSWSFDTNGLGPQRAAWGTSRTRASQFNAYNPILVANSRANASDLAVLGEFNSVEDVRTERGMWLFRPTFGGSTFVSMRDCSSIAPANGCINPNTGFLPRAIATVSEGAMGVAPNSSVSLAGFGSATGSVTFSGPAALPVIRGASTTTQDSRNASAVRAIQTYTWTGSAATTMPLVGTLDFRRSAANPWDSNPANQNKTSNSAVISVGISLFDPTVISPADMLDRLAQGDEGRCGDAGILADGFYNDGGTTPNVAITIDIQKDCLGKPFAVKPGQSFSVAMFQVLVGVRGGSVDATNTFELVFDPGAPPALIQALVEGLEPAGADPSTMLQELAAEVTGVGPGKSLADKIGLAQTYYAVPDIQATCSVLTDFTKEVRAQRGKKLSDAQADQFTADATTIIVAVGCD